MHHHAPYQLGRIVGRRGEMGLAHQRDGEGGIAKVAPFGRSRHRAGVDDIIPQIGTVVDAGHHHVRLGAHQLVDREVDAVGRRPLHRMITGFADAGDPQWHLQRQGVTCAAAVAIRCHHHDLAAGAQRLAEGTDALGMHTIVITDQNSHRFDS